MLCPVLCHDYDYETCVLLVDLLVMVVDSLDASEALRQLLAHPPVLVSAVLIASQQHLAGHRRTLTKLRCWPQFSRK